MQSVLHNVNVFLHLITVCSIDRDFTRSYTHVTEEHATVADFSLLHDSKKGVENVSHRCSTSINCHYQLEDTLSSQGSATKIKRSRHCLLIENIT